LVQPQQNALSNAAHQAAGRNKPVHEAHFSRWPGPASSKTEFKLRGGARGADQLARFDRADRMAESIVAELIEFKRRK
jgi:hypothetical protein